jgi:uncharacterized protein YutE (UPF0331/DUF86 family)
MSPEVLMRKLTALTQYHERLQRYAGASRETLDDREFEIERLLQLMLETTADMTAHMLSVRDVVMPETYREVFHCAAAQGLIPDDLAQRLDRAARQRNLLVHAYDSIDPAQVQAAVPLALEDYARVLVIANKWREELEP